MLIVPNLFFLLPKGLPVYEFIVLTSAKMSYFDNFCFFLYCDN